MCLERRVDNNYHCYFHPLRLQIKLIRTEFKRVKTLQYLPFRELEATSVTQSFFFRCAVRDEERIRLLGAAPDSESPESCLELFGSVPLLPVVIIIVESEQWWWWWTSLLEVDAIFNSGDAITLFVLLLLLSGSRDEDEVTKGDNGDTGLLLLLLCLVVVKSSNDIFDISGSDWKG